MVAAYGSNRDLTALFQTMLTDEAYAATAGSLVASPVEWVVGAMRSLHVTTDDDTVKRAAGCDAGTRPAAVPPTERQRLAVRPGLAVHRVGDDPGADRGVPRPGRPTSRRWSRRPAAGRVDAVAHLLGIPAFSDRTLAELKTHTDDPQRLVAMALVAPENLVI